MMQVSCALLLHEHKILICQRSEQMSLPLMWEFPGGKREPGETLQESLGRELLEELGIKVLVGDPLPMVLHHYEDKLVSLHPFWCQWTAGELRLYEHRNSVWISKSQLFDFGWAAADLPIVTHLHQHPHPDFT